MRRLMRWVGRREAHRHRLWVATCIVTGALAMTSALSGSARPAQATQAARRSKGSAAQLVESGGATDDARHIGVRSAVAPTTHGFVTRAFTDSSGASMTYYLYIPPAALHADPSASAAGYPVVLLLHGGGERARPSSTSAQNRSLILNSSYVNLWSSPTVQARWPSVIIVPQVTGANRWVNVPARQGSYMQPSTASGSLTLAHEILQETLAEYASVVDTRRVYITGISMGGYGTWDAIERWPQDFAAAAPISGAGDPSQVSTVARLPVWAFHGTLDTTVPVAGSRDMIAALTAAGGHPLYTEYPNAKHDIWVRVYSDPTFLAWLFAQHRPWF